MSVPQPQKLFHVTSLKTILGISIFHVPSEIPLCSGMKTTDLEPILPYRNSGEGP